MTLFQRTVSGIVWFFSGQIARMVLQLIVLMILARLIEVKVFGAISVFMAIVNFSSMFASIGAGPALILHRNISPIQLNTGFTISLSMGMFFAILLFLLSPTISNLMGMPELTSVLKTLCIIFPLEGIGVVSRSWLRRNLEFRTIAIIETSTYAIGYSVTVITLACIGFGIWAIVIAVILQTFLRNIMLLKFGPRLKLFVFSPKAGKSLLFIGGGFTLSRFADYLSRHCDRFIVGKILGATALGYYGRALTLATCFTQALGQTTKRVVFPALAQIKAEEERLRNAFEKGNQFLVLMTLPVCILTFVLAEEVVTILLGAKWWPTIAPLRILTLALLFRSSFHACDAVLQATGAVYRRAWRRYVSLVILIMLIIAGTRWGIAGVATGISLAWFFQFLLTCGLCLSLIQMKWSHFLIVLGKPIISSVALGLALSYMACFLRSNNTNVFVIVGICGCFTLMYYGLLFMLVPSLLFSNNTEWFKTKLTNMLPYR